MESLVPGVPSFDIEYECFFSRCSSSTLIDYLKRSFGCSVAGSAFGSQKEHAQELMLRVIEFKNSVWAAILPVSISATIHLENKNFLAKSSQELVSDCVFLGIYDTAGGLVYRHACTGEVTEKLTIGSDEDGDDECQLSPKSNLEPEQVIKDPYSYVDEVISQKGIILPIPIQYEKLGNILLPIEDFIQGHQGIESAYVLLL